MPGVLRKQSEREPYSWPDSPRSASARCKVGEYTWRHCWGVFIVDIHRAGAGDLGEQHAGVSKAAYPGEATGIGLFQHLPFNDP